MNYGMVNKQMGCLDPRTQDFQSSLLYQSILLFSFSKPLWFFPVIFQQSTSVKNTFPIYPYKVCNHLILNYYISIIFTFIFVISVLPSISLTGAAILAYITMYPVSRLCCAFVCSVNFSLISVSLFFLFPFSLEWVAFNLLSSSFPFFLFCELNFYFLFSPIMFFVHSFLFLLVLLHCYPCLIIHYVFDK